MRVKKFEAKTMKDALKMVKSELGPDAVILGARENKKSFGLGGETSFEVTAAVSDITLQKKRFVESRMRPDDREKFRSSQARSQKEMIEKIVERREQQQRSAREQADRNANPRPITSVSYIDIPDDQPVYARRQGIQGGLEFVQESYGRGSVQRQSASAPVQRPQTAAERAAEPRPADVRNKIRSLAKEAWEAGRATEVAPVPKRQTVSQTPATAAATTEIESLKGEIQRLQSILSGFTQVPQSFQQAASNAPVHAATYPGAEYGLSYDFSSIFQKLVETGVSAELAAEVGLRAQSEIDPMQAKKKAIVEAWVAKWFLQNISVCERPFSARFQVFTGPMGSGKTSQLVKAASQLIIRDKKKIAIVSTDTSKVGAVDQLKIYCQILNVPFAIVRGPEDWRWLESHLAAVDHVLVDMPGLGLKEADEISRLRALMPSHEQSQVHVCLSSSMKESDALDAVRRFRVTQPTDLIFTGLDLSVNHGVIATVQVRSGLPLHSFGVGPRVPEDFEAATKERVLDLLFKLSSLKRSTEK